MAQTLTMGGRAQRARQTPGSNAKAAGGVMSVVKTYIAAHGAAVRTADASFGHLRPAERDLKQLGFDHTPAYAAVVRH